MPSVTRGSLPFAEQIAFFRRKTNLPTNAWTDIWQSEHDHAFVVAGANQFAMVADFREAVDKAIAGGNTLAEFRRDFDSIVAKYGWDYNGGRNWRSRLIYETNLRASYSAGRYEQMMSMVDVRPWWQYVHSDTVAHPRPLHLAWNGIVLRYDDPWVKTHYCPNGWGCQCKWRALSHRDLAKLGKDGPDDAPPEDMQTVTVGTRGATPRTVETPAGVDPGWGYAPGRDAWLKRHAQRDIDTAITADDRDWVPLLTTRPADIGRPENIPVVRGPVPLASPLTTQEEVFAALRKQLGQDAVVLDAKGLPVIVDAEFLGQHINPARAEFLPWLTDTLTDPFEIWIRHERHRETGEIRTRLQAIKGYEVGKGRPMIVVADIADQTLLSWTFIPGRNLSYARNQRVGLLWWGKK